MSNDPTHRRTINVRPDLHREIRKTCAFFRISIGDFVDLAIARGLVDAHHDYMDFIGPPTPPEEGGEVANQ